MVKKGRKSDALWVVVGALVLATFVVSGVFLKELSTLNNAFADLTKIEYLSSSTQRLTRLVIAGQSDEKLLFYIGDQTKMALNPSSDEALSVIDDVFFAAIASDVLSSWDQVSAVISAEETDVNSLYMAADNHFYRMTDLSTEVALYTSQLNARIITIQSALTMLLSMIGLVILNNIMRTHTELKQSKDMAKVAQIDMATGLYNRSKCQELFKQNQTVRGKKHPAMIVFDLNDLKKTNDVQGHRMGDELIHSFAAVLKSACDVHIVPPFIGRYGGDEFIVYYEDVESEEDIRVYLKELQFLANEFNNDSSHFKVSYAAGYALTTDADSNLTTRQLFDRADEAMYANKVAMKAQRQQESSDSSEAKGDLKS